MHAFLLVNYWRTDVYFNSLLYKINRFQVAVRLFSNRSQMTSKCGKNKKVAHEAQPQQLGIYLLTRLFFPEKCKAKQVYKSVVLDFYIFGSWISLYPPIVYQSSKRDMYSQRFWKIAVYFIERSILLTEKDVFRLVTSVGQEENSESPWGIEPQTDALPLTHRDSMVSEVITKFI